MATTDGEGSGGRTIPTLPEAYVSLIWKKPSLIHPKNGRFLHVTDGKRNVLIRPFQRVIVFRITYSP